MCKSQIKFCHIERSREAILVPDFAGTESKTNLHVQMVK